MAYYDHYWSEMWSSSIGYSFTEVANTNFQAPDAFHKGEYASVNLLAYPAKNVMVGRGSPVGQAHQQRRHYRR